MRSDYQNQQNRIRGCACCNTSVSSSTNTPETNSHPHSDSSGQTASHQSISNHPRRGVTTNAQANPRPGPDWASHGGEKRSAWVQLGSLHTERRCLNRSRSKNQGSVPCRRRPCCLSALGWPAQPPGPRIGCDTASSPSSSERAALCPPCWTLPHAPSISCGRRLVGRCTLLVTGPVARADLARSAQRSNRDTHPPKKLLVVCRTASLVSVLAGHAPIGRECPWMPQPHVSPRPADLRLSMPPSPANHRLTRPGRKSNTSSLLTCLCLTTSAAPPVRRDNAHI